MSTAAPAPLLVRPSTGMVMHSLIQANPAVPASYQPPDVPKMFFQTLQVCRELGRAVTVAELAARVGHSPAVAAVAATELAALDLVRVVRAPALAERLRTWATHTRPIPVVASVIKILAVGAQQQYTRHAVADLTEAEPWCLQGTPRVELATAHMAQDLQMLTLGVTGLNLASPVRDDVCRGAFGALVITGPARCDLATSHQSLVALHQANVPVVVLVHQTEDEPVDIDVVRASLGLSARTPVVVADVQNHGACQAVMDLCSSLMSGGRR